MNTDIRRIDPATRPFRLALPLDSLRSDIYYGPHKIGMIAITKVIDPCGLDSSAEVEMTFEIGNDEKATRIKREFEAWLKPRVKELIRAK